MNLLLPLLLPVMTAQAADVEPERAPFTEMSGGSFLGNLFGFEALVERGVPVGASFFSVQPSLAVGINPGGNVEAAPGLALGRRRFVPAGGERVRATFLGVYGGTITEFERGDTYQYAVGGVRASIGHREDLDGIDFGILLGYGQQLSGPWWDYSGVRGGLEVRWVWGA